MRAALVIIAALGLAACETTANEGGVANYDALRQASQQCQAQGGHLVLRPGGDSENIQDYACEKGK
jgi:uncharacterized lipoprotein YmbA